MQPSQRRKSLSCCPNSEFAILVAILANGSLGVEPTQLCAHRKQRCPEKESKVGRPPRFQIFYSRVRVRLHLRQGSGPAPSFALAAFLLADVDGEALGGTMPLAASMAAARVAQTSPTRAHTSCGVGTDFARGGDARSESSLDNRRYKSLELPRAVQSIRCPRHVS